jgi:hypothetical protein
MYPSTKDQRKKINLACLKMTQHGLGFGGRVLALYFDTQHHKKSTHTKKSQ